MEILLINAHSFHNAGDHVLTTAGVEQLRRLFPGCHITVALNDPASFERQEGSVPADAVDTFFSWYKEARNAPGMRRYVGLISEAWNVLLSLVVALWYRLAGASMAHLLPAKRRPAIEAYLHADMVVSTAGNYLYSRSHELGVSLLAPYFTIAYASLCAKPLYMLPQTIGPIWRGWERWTLNALLRSFRLLLLRDPTSVELVESLSTGDTPYELSPDLAFVYEGETTEAGWRKLQSYGVEPGRPLLGVTVLDWGAQQPAFVHQDRYERAVASTMRHFVEMFGGQAILFAQVCGPTPPDDDRVAARRVLARLSEWGVPHVHMADAEFSPSTLQAAYSCCDLFLGTRLHSNIFALVRRVPSVAIAYQDKTVGVMRMLGLQDWSIRIEDVEERTLIPLVVQLWQQRDAVMGDVARGVSRLQATTDVALDRISTDYAGLQRTKPWRPSVS